MPFLDWQTQALIWGKSLGPCGSGRPRTSERKDLRLFAVQLDDNPRPEALMLIGFLVLK